MSLKSRGAALFASAVIASGMVTSSALPASAQTTSGCSVTSTDQAVDSEELAFLGLINHYRGTFGKNALSQQTNVARAAAWFSRDMATKNYFAAKHIDSNGRTLDQRLRWCGATFTNWAENIFAGRGDAQSAFNAWKNSPGHNANMLRDGVTAVGIARAYQAGSTYGWYWTLDFTNTPVTIATTTTTAVRTSTTVAPTTTTTRPASTTTTTIRPWYCTSYPQYC